MTMRDRIRAQGQVASDLAAQQERVLDRLKDLDFTRDLIGPADLDLSRLSEPTVGLVGDFSSGKSALVNRFSGVDLLPVCIIPATKLPVFLAGSDEPAVYVGRKDDTYPLTGDEETVRKRITAPEDGDCYILWESPELRDLPWCWLDLPGTNAEDDTTTDCGFELGDMADLFVLVVDVQRPMSISDGRNAEQLAQLFPGRSWIVALTKVDLVSSADAERSREYVRNVLGALDPGREVETVFFSSKSDWGLYELRKALMQEIIGHQREGLDRELTTWEESLRDIERLLLVKGVERVPTDTIEQARSTVKGAFYKEIEALKQGVGKDVEDVLQQLAEQLPATEQKIAREFGLGLGNRLQVRTENLARRLDEAVDNAMEAGGLDDEARRALVDGATGVVALGQNPFPTVGRSAAVGAGIGAVSGLLTSSFVPVIGLAVGSLATAAGLSIGGLLGGRRKVRDVATLRDRVAKPAARVAMKRVDALAVHGDKQLDAMFDQMLKAVDFYDGAEVEEGQLKDARKLVAGAIGDVGDLKQQLDEAAALEDVGR